jgi:hypothetical protein
MMFQDVVIVIPAYEPDDRLLELLKTDDKQPFVITFSNTLKKLEKG